MSMEISNILKLTKIHFKKYNPLLLIFLALIPVFVAIDNKNLFTGSYAIFSINGSLYCYALFGLFLLCLVQEQIEHKNQIGVFPGTTKTRYLAQLLANHLLIVGIILLEILYYILDITFLYLFSRFLHPVNTDFLFSWRFFGYSLLMTLLLFLLLYGVTNLFLIILQRVHPAVTVALLIVIPYVLGIFFFIGSADNSFSMEMEAFSRLIPRRHFFLFFAVFSLGCWMLSLLIGYFHALVHNTWELIHGKGRLCVAMYAGYLLIQVIWMSNLIDTWNYNYVLFPTSSRAKKVINYLERHEEQLQHRDYLVEGDAARGWLTWHENSSFISAYDIDNHSHARYSYDEFAAEEEPLYRFNPCNSLVVSQKRWNTLAADDESVSLKSGQALLKLYMPSVSLHGNDIYQAILEQTELTNEVEQYPYQDQAAAQWNPDQQKAAEKIHWLSPVIHISQRPIKLHTLINLQILYRGSCYENLFNEAYAYNDAWETTSLYESCSLLVIITADDENSTP